MLGQGHNYSLTMGTQESNWRRLRVGNGATMVDVTSKLFRDGTVNTGFSDTVGDIGTMTFEMEDVADPGNFARDFATLAAGVDDSSKSWLVSYGGVPLYSGTGVYYEALDMEGSIPGEGTVVLRFRSIGRYTKLF